MDPFGYKRDGSPLVFSYRGCNRKLTDWFPQAKRFLCAAPKKLHAIDQAMPAAQLNECCTCEPSLSFETQFGPETISFRPEPI
jgi:hypothetical protein